MVVVVSALGDTTDELIKLPVRLPIDHLDGDGHAAVHREQVSISLLAMAVDSLGEPVISLTGAQCGIITDDQHTKARILDQANRIEELGKGKIVVVAGFRDHQPQ